jgi:hypothetical protein
LDKMKMSIMLRFRIIVMAAGQVRDETGDQRYSNVMIQEGMVKAHSQLKVVSEGSLSWACSWKSTILSCETLTFLCVPSLF